jgi:predicted RNA methylase
LYENNTSKWHWRVVVKDNLDFSLKHAAAVVLGGLIAVSLVRRNFLGILNAVNGRVGVGDHPFVILKSAD